MSVNNKKYIGLTLEEFKNTIWNNFMREWKNNAEQYKTKKEFIPKFLEMEFYEEGSLDSFSPSDYKPFISKLKNSNLIRSDVDYEDIVINICANFEKEIIEQQLKIESLDNQLSNRIIKEDKSIIMNDEKEIFELVGYEELQNELICEFDLGNLDRQEEQEKIHEILQESKTLDEAVTEDGYSYSSKYPDSRQSQLSSIISINYKEKNLYIVIINSDEIDNELFTICNTEEKAREVFNNNLAPVFNNFISKENFKDFLDNNLKTKDYDFNSYLDDLETQYGNTGMKEYELKGNETKTGNTATYNYEFIHKRSEEKTAKELRDYLVDLEGTNEISYLGLAIAHSIVNQLENNEQKMTEKELISITESIAESEELNNFIDSKIYDSLDIRQEEKEDEEEDQL